MLAKKANGTMSDNKNNTQHQEHHAPLNYVGGGGAEAIYGAPVELPER